MREGYKRKPNTVVTTTCRNYTHMGTLFTYRNMWGIDLVVYPQDLCNHWTGLVDWTT